MRIVLILTLLCLFPWTTQAQISLEGFSANQPSIESKPAYPSPQEEVTLTLNDYQSGGFGTAITWYQDKNELKGSANRRSITIEAPAAGEQTIVSANLTVPGQGNKTITHVIKPHHLDLIVEPQTHVPDFYIGRALPSLGSTVQVTALVNGTSGTTNTDIYMWRMNDTVLEGGPLRGQNRISFIVPMGQLITLSLQVSTIDGVVLARRTIAIPSVRPKINFYEVNTLYGVNTISLINDFSLIGNSATIKAEPYYLDSKVFNNPDVLQWDIDETIVQNSESNPYDITIERTGYVGAARLSFQVRSMDIILQSAKHSMNINPL